jgi:phosphotransferase system enzyme I (PtsI)
MANSSRSKQKDEIILKGIPVSKGYASGNAFIFRHYFSSINNNNSLNVNSEEEIGRFLQTIEDYENELERHSKYLSKENPLAREILDSIKLILQDPDIKDNVINLIQQGKSAEEAVEATYKKYENELLSVKSKVIRERAYEIEQIKNRFLELLTTKRFSLGVPENSIVVATSLSADQVISFKEKNVVGLITEVGGTTTHSSILARSFRIPAVIGIANATKTIHNGDFVLVDGYKGIIIVNPSKKSLEEFKRDVEEEAELTRLLGELIHKPTRTKDGKKVELQANLNYVEELNETELYYSDGIGLVRTEHLVPIRDYYTGRLSLEEFEQKQYEIFHEVALKMYPKPVVFRVFDLGGDKFPSLFGVNETNPMLGFRGIRYLLANPKFFKAQLRAILRASVEKNLQIMLPMITMVDEVTASLKLIEECKKELSKKGIEYDPNIKVGIMIETPSAALQADVLACYVDFMSIGTNDLTQYTLVADRENSQVGSYFSPFHPSVLKLMRFTIRSAKSKRKKVGICGELASHPAATGLLIGLGFDSISVSIPNLLQVKKWISEIDSKTAKQQLQSAIKLATSDEVRALLEIQ